VWPAEKREWGSAAAVTTAILNGAHVVRVHDVNEMSQAARIADLILSAARRP
jgi:dihydropteroate synthase